MKKESLSSNPNFGLPAWVLPQIKTILTNEPRVEKVVLFGSRAKGLHKPGSDIDLALFGDHLYSDSLSNLSQQFDESSLPWKVDLVVVNTIDNQNLLDHILRVGVVIYEKVVHSNR